MNNIVTISFLFVLQTIFSQVSEKLLPPAILVNSLELKIEFRDGKNYYSFKDKNKKLLNRSYRIMVNKKSVKDHDSSIGGEGKDYRFGAFFKGNPTKIIKKGFFKDGYKDGLWEATYKNKIVKKVNWNKGLIRGKYLIKDINGSLLYETDFGAKGNGMLKDFYYKTGVLKQEGNYENGKKEGEWCSYDAQGKLTGKKYYKDNNEYIVEEFRGFKNGDYTKLVYKEDDLFKSFTRFYSNGNIKIKGSLFFNDFNKGVWKYYNEEGNLTKEKNWDAPFTFSWEDVRAYLNKHEVTEIKKVINVSRCSDDSKTTWTLEFNGVYKEIFGSYVILLDGKTGEELEVKLFKGKKALRESGTVADYDIIYKK